VLINVNLELMKNELIGGLLIFLILILIEFIDLIRVIMLIMLKGSMKMELIYWIINITFPPLNSKRLILILLKTSSSNLCKLIENDKDILSKIGFVKEINENDFSKYLFIFLIQIIFLFILICLIDLNIFNKRINYLNNDQFDEDELDDDVLKERIYLISNKYLLNDPFICIDLIKKYPLKEDLAINHLTFSIQQGQCFGLLGFNGAGLIFFYFIIKFIYFIF